MWEYVVDCIHKGLLFYSFGFFPCVRVHWGLCPLGLTVLHFWFSPLCESLLQTVSTWDYCFTLLVFSLVWESVANCIHLLFYYFFFVWESIADCIHISLLLHSFSLLPCVQVRGGLYPHGLTALLFWFAPLCESPLQTVSTWAYCFILLLHFVMLAADFRSTGMFFWGSCIPIAYC